MEIHGMFANGVNVVSLKKGEKFYAMTCAWATQIDFDRAIMCLGGQSETGNSIKVGDIIGISALSEDQKKIGNSIGSSHSSETDKFLLAPFEEVNGAYLVKGAKTKIVGKVIYIEHFKESEEDSIIQIKVIDGSTDPDKEFLVYKTDN